MKRICVLVLASIIVLSGCTDVPPLAKVVETHEAVSPLPPADSPLPTPQPAPVQVLAPAEPPAIPTPDADLATIEGSIAMSGHEPGVFPATLYLGDPSGSQPVGAYVALDVQTAPQGYVRPDGSFIFPNLRPGLYTIVVWTPGGAYLVPDPSTGHTWLIEVEGTASFQTGHIQVPAVAVP